MVLLGRFLRALSVNVTECGTKVIPCYYGYLVEQNYAVSLWVLQIVEVYSIHITDNVWSSCILYNLGTHFLVFSSSYQPIKSSFFESFHTHLEDIQYNTVHAHWHSVTMCSGVIVCSRWDYLLWPSWKYPGCWLSCNGTTAGCGLRYDSKALWRCASPPGPPYAGAFLITYRQSEVIRSS